MDRALPKKKWNQKRIITIAGITGLVILVTGSIYLTSGKSKLNVDVERITISEVGKGKFQKFIPVNGIVMPLSTIYLDAAEGGRVEEKFVEDGAMMKKGDPIMRLSNTDLELSLANQETAVFDVLTQMQKYDLQLNRLFDLDVIYDAPWNSPDPSNPSLIHISADNMFYKDCLLAVYTQLLENIKSTGLDGKNELLQENEILKRKIQSEKEEEGYKEDTPEAVNLVFRMVLMYQLGILDKSKWPEKATQDQISRILATILGSEQSPVKTTSIKRYLKALMNGDYEGKKIRDKYDQKVREFLKNSFLS